MYNFIKKYILIFGFLIFSTEASARMVTVTAYNTVPAQTSGNPNIGRCGKIKPGSKIIAVSRDLLKKYDCGDKVLLNGKKYTVWDTMHPRWKNKVDICFHKRVNAALEFGKKRMELKPAKI